MDCSSNESFEHWASYSFHLLSPFFPLIYLLLLSPFCSYPWNIFELLSRRPIPENLSKLRVSILSRKCYPINEICYKYRTVYGLEMKCESETRNNKISRNSISNVMTVNMILNSFLQKKFFLLILQPSAVCRFGCGRSQLFPRNVVFPISFNFRPVDVFQYAHGM